MSRQGDLDREDRQARIERLAMRSIRGGLAFALRQQGRELLGFSVRIGAMDILVTVRANKGGEREICFVGSETIAGALAKAEREAVTDKLTWRPDMFAKD